MESGGQDTTYLLYSDKILPTLGGFRALAASDQVVRSPRLETRKSEVCLPPLDFFFLMYYFKPIENVYVHNY